MKKIHIAELCGVVVYDVCVVYVYQQTHRLMCLHSYYVNVYHILIRKEHVLSKLSLNLNEGASACLHTVCCYNRVDTLLQSKF